MPPDALFLIIKMFREIFYILFPRFHRLSHATDAVNTEKFYSTIYNFNLHVYLYLKNMTENNKTLRQQKLFDNNPFC